MYEWAEQVRLETKKIFKRHKGIRVLLYTWPSIVKISSGTKPKSRDRSEVKQMLKPHGGQVRAEIEWGRGSAFSISLVYEE